MDVQALSAVQKYTASRPATEPGVVAETAQNIFADFEAAFAQTEATAKAAMTGDADPHALVQALAQTELAVETAVTIRNKVVEAYQEILRMPV